MKRLFLVFLFTTTVAQAETYKWTDNVGTVHFSESLGEVPANYRKSAVPLGMDTRTTPNTSAPASSAEPRQQVDDSGGVTRKSEELKEQMLKDEGIMALIRSMQNDPEMQLLLSDPAIIGAIQTGDISTLIENPAFLKLLNNPRVREIENKMQKSGTK